MMNENDPDQLYYNASIFGGLSGNYNLMVYTDTRTQPLLMNPSQYNLILSSFAIPTSYLPLRIIEIENAPNTDINRTVYIPTLKYGIHNFPVPIQWVSEYDTTLGDFPIPLSVSINQVDTEHYIYYTLRTIEHFINLLNIAISSAFSQLIFAEPTITATLPPTFSFNSETKLISVTVQRDFVTQGIELSFNLALYTFFLNSFLGIYCISAGCFTFNFIDKPLELVTIAPYGSCIKYTQETNTINKFYSGSGFRSIEIISVNIPIYNEFIQNQDPRTGLAITTGSQTTALLTDYHVDISTGNELHGTLYYNPTAEYRRISFHSSTPLTKFAFFIQWRDNYGNTYPMVVPVGETAQIKFLFEKKKHI